MCVSKLVRLGFACLCDVCGANWAGGGARRMAGPGQESGCSTSLPVTSGMDVIRRNVDEAREKGVGAARPALDPRRAATT
jgi:hypothetical protein